MTATIVMLFPGNGPLWDIPLIRLGEVTLGTVCALLVRAVLARIERWWWPAHRHEAPDQADWKTRPPPAR